MKKAFIAIPVVFFVIVIILFKIERNVHVERSVIINAPVNEVKQQIIDFRNYHKWSPWAKIDTNMTLNFNELQGEIGATYSWIGNDKIGSGSQTLVGISKDSITIDLTYHRTSSQMSFKLQDQNGLTKIKWNYDSDMSFLITLLIDMDQELGNLYEQGLIDLKELTE